MVASLYSSQVATITHDGQTVVDGGGKIFDMGSMTYSTEMDETEWHSISPDGNYLAYFSGPDSNSDQTIRTLNMLNRETGNVEDIPGVVAYRYNQYQFSADSRSISYTKPDISMIEEGEELICGQMRYSLSVDRDCIDIDGDGWGWNGIQSCRITEEADDCDYSSAAIHNGWGWNPTTDESCSPRSGDYCDYRYADLNDGWGWNPITRESCPRI